jgi:hypothetical protein
MIKKTFFIVIFTISTFISYVNAQSYGTAIGIRIDGFGLTLQQQIAPHSTIEGILQSGIKKQDITLTLLYELHQGLLTRNLSFYWGGGLYKTWYDRTDVTRGLLNDAFGVSPIVGLELNIGKIILSGDIKPTLKLSGDGRGFTMGQGISIRYELAGRYFKNEDWKFWKKWKKKK